MSYYLALLSVLVIATVLTPLLALYRKRLSADSEFRFVKVLMVLVIISYSVWSCYKYLTFRAGLWDLGIYDSMVHNLAFFRGFMQDYRGGFDHFSPLIVLWVPLYWIYDNACSLLVGQAFCMALAAIPLYHCVRLKLKKPGFALLICSMYLLNPYLSRMLLTDFHIECMFPLFLFSAWYFFLKRRMLPFMIILLVAPMIKEDFIIVLIAVGLLLCSRKQYIVHGVACLVASVGFILFVLFVWQPCIIGEAYLHAHRYPKLFGPTIVETVTNALTIFSNGILRPTVIPLLLSLIVPFAFLPLFAPRYFVLLFFPVLLAQICSNASIQYQLEFHYSSGVIAVLPIVALAGLENAILVYWRLRKSRQLQRGSGRLLICWCLILAVVVHLCFCDLPYMRRHNYLSTYKFDRQMALFSTPIYNWFYVTQVIPYAAVIWDIKANLSPDLSITAQNNIGYIFIRNRKVYSLPGKEGCDLYIFCPRLIGGFDRNNYEKVLQYISQHPGYALIYDKHQTYIYCRKDKL